MWVIDDCLDTCLIARKHVWKKDRAINPKDRPCISRSPRSSAVTCAQPGRPLGQLGYNNRCRTGQGRSRGDGCAKGGAMRFVNRVLCVLACAASIGGTVVPARNANAQTLPPSAACVAACADGIGDCTSGAAAALGECMMDCKTQRGKKRAACVQACAAKHKAAVPICRAAFESCVAACPAA